ncbi:MAG: hypothetical protein JXR76_17695 [Deltaproteobacteria bacterium]|nr:hypothetical protein [Deltaproteobacteria bacterium]
MPIYVRYVVALESKMLKLTRYARKRATGFRPQAKERKRVLERLTVVITSVAVLFSILIAVVVTRRVKSIRNTLRHERNQLRKS